jgi:hypothetical protein
MQRHGWLVLGLLALGGAATAHAQATWITHGKTLPTNRF